MRPRIMKKSGPVVSVIIIDPNRFPTIYELINMTQNTPKYSPFESSVEQLEMYSPCATHMMAVPNPDIILAMYKKAITKFLLTKTD